jgi:hypothetical protein
MKKTGSKNSRDTVPLRSHYSCPSEVGKVEWRLLVAIDNFYKVSLLQSIGWSGPSLLSSLDAKKGPYLMWHQIRGDSQGPSWSTYLLGRQRRCGWLVPGSHYLKAKWIVLLPYAWGQQRRGWSGPIRFLSPRDTVKDPPIYLTRRQRRVGSAQALLFPA